MMKDKRTNFSKYDEDEYEFEESLKRKKRSDKNKHKEKDRTYLDEYVEDER